MLQLFSLSFWAACLREDGGGKCSSGLDGMGWLVARHGSGVRTSLGMESWWWSAEGDRDGMPPPPPPFFSRQLKRGGGTHSHAIMGGGEIGLVCSLPLHQLFFPFFSPSEVEKGRGGREGKIQLEKDEEGRETGGRYARYGRVQSSPFL